MDIYKFNWTILDNRIFSLLCFKSGEKFSQRELAKFLGISPTAAGNAVKRLEKKGLVKIDKIKTINFISLNRDNELAINLKRVENLKNIYISGIIDYLREELPGGIIMLFGSYSRGEDTKKSDIDIAIIGRNSKRIITEKYDKLLNREIRINFYDSWKEINENLKNNILNGIRLHGGIEL
jgi:predicted nucleotidyltransferase